MKAGTVVAIEPEAVEALAMLIVHLVTPSGPLVALTSMHVALRLLEAGAAPETRAACKDAGNRVDLFVPTAEGTVHVTPLGGVKVTDGQPS